MRPRLFPHANPNEACRILELSIHHVTIVTRRGLEPAFATYVKPCFIDLNFFVAALGVTTCTVCVFLKLDEAELASNVVDWPVVDVVGK